MSYSLLRKNQMQYLRIHIVLAGAADFVVHVRRDFNRALLLPVVQRGLQLVVALLPHVGFLGPLFIRLFDHVFLYAA